MASLINVDVTRARSAAMASPVADAASMPPNNQASEKGVFITTQSLITFPGASTLVTVIWQVLGVVDSTWGSDKRIALLIALIVGMAIYYVSAKPEQTRKEQITGVLVALFNSFFLAATALGIAAVS